MQLLYLIFAGLFFINFSISKKLQCYHGLSTNSNLKDVDELEGKNGLNLVVSAPCDDICMSLTMSLKGDKGHFLMVASSCEEKNKCKESKKASPIKLNGREIYNMAKDDDDSKTKEELNKLEDMGMLNKDSKWTITVKCCERDHCNSGSALKKMGKYVVGSILSATFLILLL